MCCASSTAEPRTDKAARVAAATMAEATAREGATAQPSAIPAMMALMDDDEHHAASEGMAGRGVRSMSEVHQGHQVHGLSQNGYG